VELRRREEAVGEPHLRAGALSLVQQSRPEQLVERAILPPLRGTPFYPKRPIAASRSSVTISPWVDDRDVRQSVPCPAAHVRIRRSASASSAFAALWPLEPGMSGRADAPLGGVQRAQRGEGFLDHNGRSGSVREHRFAASAAKR
jgi:hypothetical protein